MHQNALFAPSIIRDPKDQHTTVETLRFRFSKLCRQTRLCRFGILSYLLKAESRDWNSQEWKRQEMEDCLGLAYICIELWWKKETKQMIPIITNSSYWDVNKGVHESQMSGLRLMWNGTIQTEKMAACNKHCSKSRPWLINQRMYVWKTLSSNSDSAARHFFTSSLHLSKKG